MLLIRQQTRLRWSKETRIRISLSRVFDADWRIAGGGAELLG